MRDLEAKPEEQLTLQAQVAAFLDAILDAPRWLIPNRSESVE